MQWIGWGWSLVVLLFTIISASHWCMLPGHFVFSTKIISFWASFLVCLTLKTLYTMPPVLLLFECFQHYLGNIKSFLKPNNIPPLSLLFTPSLLPSLSPSLPLWYLFVLQVFLLFILDLISSHVRNTLLVQSLSWF